MSDTSRSAADSAGEMRYQWRKPWVSCEVVRRAVHAKGHCTSCHDDFDAGDGMCEIDTPKGVVAVCCEVYSAASDIAGPT